MSKEAAAGDIRTMSPGVAEALAVVMAASKDSTTVKRGSVYFSAKAWPDSPRRIIFLMFLVSRIS